VPPVGQRRNRLLLAVVVLFVLAFILVPFAADRITDWLWFREIGFERVFFLQVIAEWTLGVIFGLGALAAFYANARLALRGFDPNQVEIRGPATPLNNARLLLLGRLARIVVWPVSLAMSAFIATVAAADWKTLIQFYYRSNFGVVDPIFGRDVSYYVFTVPVIDAALSYVTLTLMVALILVALPVYVLRGEIGMNGLRARIEPLAQHHVAVLIVGLLATAGLRGLLVDVPDVLQAAHVPLQGANYTDLHVRLLMIRIVGIATLAGATWVLLNAWRGLLVRSIPWVIVAYVALNIVLLGVVPTVFQRLVVQPNELVREAPQIRNYIKASRQAWGIDSVERHELGASSPLTWKDIENNRATINNIRLWDRDELLQTFGQIQAIRTYYDFVNVDDDRYRIGGDLRQVLLSARELNIEALPTRSFINEHLTYTHGMGVTLGPSNQVTAEGLPELWIKDLPPQSSISVTVKRPQIYFGELANEFVFVPTRQKELDYPSGEGDGAVYSTYAGKAGVAVESLWRRVLFAFRFRSVNILLSGDLLPESKVLLNRNVVTRAGLALPFLQFDGDPYLVITDAGELKWILDAYTTTDRYPYAQRVADGTNYMRNSVKVVVDAYDGTITAYLSDPADPMIRTLSRIYPGFLRPLSEMPADVRRHVRYPEDLFRLQTALYTTFHMEDAETFYHREDQWEVPVAEEKNGRGELIRHMVMRLPGETEPEYLIMRPFTPRQKDNLSAWMVARNDGANYGKLVVYAFPRQSLVFGPKQIVNRINQNTDVSREVSLWDQRGSQVIRGELLVIPIEHSLIYVQPLYLQAQGGRIPELKRVIVVRENEVAMAETLEGALRTLFGVAGGSAPVVASADSSPVKQSKAPTDLIREAQQHYDRARAAQRNDDWATYGEEMRKLGDVLRRIAAGKG
jgi:uncharacterized membrane protein (UPF0182 family)